MKINTFGFLLWSIYLSNSFASDIPAECDPFVLQTNNLPQDHRLFASVANGHIGTIVYHPIFHLNGFYNGNTSNSTFAKIPNPIAFWINDSGFVTTRNYMLDLYNGVYVENISNENFTVFTKLYAHKKYKSIMVAELEITKSPTFKEDLKLFLTSLQLNLDQIDDMKILQEEKNDTYNFLKVTSLVQEIEGISGPNVSIISTTLPEYITVSAQQMEESVTFLFTATVNDDQNGWLDFELALQMEANGSLYDSHSSAWNKLWNEGGRIDIEGNCSLAQTVHASFYYIISSMPTQELNHNISHKWPFFGICPTSLAQLDILYETYWGHVFWDQETWMLPPIQIFYPDVIRRILIESRIRNLSGAMDKARSLNYTGAMYPWESAYTGSDTSNWLPAVLREIHITGDIALEMQQYLFLTKDKQFVVDDNAYQVFFEIARFWESRAIYQSDIQMYGILDVMGPDEYHDHVNNSAYTNAIAQISLQLPDAIYKRYIQGSDMEHNFPKPDEIWLEIANKLYVPFDASLAYHPEFDGYNKSESIKQADVVLMGYPLMYQMSEEVRRNDLTIYEQVTSAEGPAMTWSMHTIGWLEIGEETRAATLFQKNFAYVKEPFKIWTENSHGFEGAINFVTGMGGFLQSILNGYFGIRIYEDKFEFKPYPIPYTTGYEIKSMKYLGNIFDAKVADNSFNLTVTSSQNLSNNFCLQQYSTGQQLPFISYANLPLGKYAISTCTTNGTDSTTSETDSTTSETDSTTSGTDNCVSPIFLVITFMIFLNCL